ncbi:unnamed protein product, partial [Didymodactylos carnosus]
YPPFYSLHGQAISAGMKSKIRAGEYQFPKQEWEKVSKEAKDLITLMLTTEPQNRPTIEKVMESSWISRYGTHVPETPLEVPKVLNEEMQNWSEIKAEIHAANAYNRRADEDEVKLNPVSNCVLLKRRQQKRDTAAVQLTQIDEQLSTENAATT